MNLSSVKINSLKNRSNFFGSFLDVSLVVFLVVFLVVLSFFDYLVEFEINYK